MSKFSNAKLLMLLVALAASIGLMMYLDSLTGESNFKTSLVKVDTAKISSIYIYPKTHKGQEVKLFKEGGEWKVRAGENKNQSVAQGRISGLFQSITGIKPSRLAARTTDKWQEYEVDTSGTRVKVNEGNKKTLDITIGKFNFVGGRDIETYVRLEGDNETYAVNGYLEGTFNASIDDWRDKTLIKGDKDNWNNLSFSYGDTLHFQLTKQDGKWTLNGLPANQEDVNAFLTAASTFSGSEFVDDVDAASLGNAQFVLDIDDGKIKVEGFIIGVQRILRSSLNADNLMNANAGNLWEKIFVDRSKFAQQEDVAIQ